MANLKKKYGFKKPTFRVKNPFTETDKIIYHEFNGKFYEGKDGKRHKAGTIEKILYDYYEETRNPTEGYIKKVLLIRQIKKCRSLKEVERLEFDTTDCKTVKDAYKKAKRKLGKHVYLSCTFDGKGCTDKNVTGVTCLLGYDLQGITPQQAEALKEDSRIVIMHKSIGGGPGDYAVILWAPGATVDNYKQLWQMGRYLLEKEFGIAPGNIDETNDCTRVRYRSYHRSIHYNECAQPVFISEIVVDTNFTAEQKKRINKYLDQEPTWYKFLLSLAVVYGERGRTLAHTFSKENRDKYDTAKVDEKYTECLTKISNGTANKN